MDTNRDQELASLLLRAQDGDQAAYETFLLEASSTLRAYLFRRMHHPEMVEDVLQETLLSIHRARHTYVPGRPVGPWLFAICTHRVTDFYRRYRRIERVEVQASDEVVERVQAPTRPDDNRRGSLVRDALTKLPERQRMVIELLKVHDFTVKEAAARTGLTESAVKITAFRGYQRLRRMLGAM